VDFEGKKKGKRNERRLFYARVYVGRELTFAR